MSNAIQSLDASGKADKKIEITSTIVAGHAVLTISDNGTGINPEQSERIFDPFYSTKLEEGGMGLGLAIVKQYLDKYGGTIAAAGNEEGGATFTIRIPVTETKQRGKNS